MQTAANIFVSDIQRRDRMLQAKEFAVQEIGVNEAASILRVSGARVRQMLISGELTGRKLGGHVWLIRRDAVERLRDQRKKDALAKYP